MNARAQGQLRDDARDVFVFRDDERIGSRFLYASNQCSWAPGASRSTSSSLTGRWAARSLDSVTCVPPSVDTQRIRRSANIHGSPFGLQRILSIRQEFKMLETVLTTSLVIGFIAVGGITLTLIAIAAGFVKV